MPDRNGESGIRPASKAGDYAGTCGESKHRRGVRWASSCSLRYLSARNPARRIDLHLLRAADAGLAHTPNGKETPQPRPSDSWDTHYAGRFCKFLLLCAVSLECRSRADRACPGRGHHPRLAMRSMRRESRSRNRPVSPLQPAFRARLIIEHPTLKDFIGSPALRLALRTQSIPISKLQIWRLGFGASLGIGAWCLGF